MERDTLHVLSGARIDALAGFVRLVMHEGEAEPAELIRVAADFRRSDPARALAVLRGLALHAAPNERLIDELIETGLTAEDGSMLDAAIAEVHDVLKRSDVQENALSERVLSRLIAAGDLSRAVSFASFATSRVTSPRFWYLALRAAERIGDEKAVLVAADALSKTRILDPAHLLNAGVILLRFGRAQQVVDMIAANEGAGNHPQITRLKLDAELRLGRSDELSLAALRAGAAENPTDIRIVNLEAQLLLNLDRPAEAVEAFARVPVGQINHTMRLRYGKAMELSGNLDGAIEIYGSVLDQHPSDAALRRKLVGLCVRAGHSEEAQRIYQAGLTKWANALAPGVAENVSAILSRNCADAIPAPRAIWFERALTEAGSPPPPDWRQKAGQMAEIDQFIVQFAQAHPDGTAQLASLVELTVEAVATLEEGLSFGKGAFIASAHVGLLYAGPIAMNKHGGPFAYVASVPDLGQHGMSNGLISTSTNDLSGVGRRILKALRSNATVAIAIDGAGITSEERRPFFDKVIRLSDFVPRLAWRTGTPSFFPRITLVNGLARFRIEQLPMPGDGESANDYAGRWLDAYVTELETFLKEHPEAMRGSGGFWSRITEA